MVGSRIPSVVCASFGFAPFHSFHPWIDFVYRLEGVFQVNETITPIKTGDIVTDFDKQPSEIELNILSNLWHQGKLVDNSLNIK